MNAERLAEYLEQGHSAFNGSAAAMLRRQHEVIKVLREALRGVEWSNDSKWQTDRAKQALKDTEEFQ